MSRTYDVAIEAKLTVPPNQAGGRDSDREDMAGLVGYFLAEMIRDASGAAIPPGLGIEVTSVIVTDPPPPHDCDDWNDGECSQCARRVRS